MHDEEELSETVQVSALDSERALRQGIVHACDDASSVALEGPLDLVDIGLLGILVKIRDGIRDFDRALFESAGGERGEVDKLGHTTGLLKCFSTFLIGVAE